MRQKNLSNLADSIESNKLLLLAALLCSIPPRILWTCAGARANALMHNVRWWCAFDIFVQWMCVGSFVLGLLLCRTNIKEIKNRNKLICSCVHVLYTISTFRRECHAHIQLACIKPNRILNSFEWAKTRKRKLRFFRFKTAQKQINNLRACYKWSWWKMKRSKSCFRVDIWCRISFCHWMVFPQKFFVI